MLDFHKFISSILDNATLIGVTTLIAALVSVLGAILEKTAIGERFFNRRAEEKKVTHKITIVLDGQEITAEGTTKEDIEAALKRVRNLLERSETSSKTNNSSTVKSHTPESTQEEHTEQQQ